MDIVIHFNICKLKYSLIIIHRISPQHNELIESCTLDDIAAVSPIICLIHIYPFYCNVSSSFNIIGCCE